MRMERVPQADERVQAWDYVKCCGGVSATAASAHQKLGGRTGIITAVGKDDAGVFIRQDLKEQNFRECRILESPDASSSVSLIQVDACLLYTSREEDVKQPLTADVWGAGAEHPYGWLKNPGIYADVERTAIELSDIITFHFYGDYAHSRMYIKCLKEYGRPMINTEWMHRPYRSIIQTHLPLWKKERCV